MARNYQLSFATSKGDFSFPITLEKSYTERAALKTGYKTDSGYQLVRYIKVVPKIPDKKITTPKDIGHICTTDEIVNVHANEDEYVPIDKASLKDMFPTDPEMRVLYTIKKSSVPFQFISDKHYFVHLSASKSSKKKYVDEDDRRLYNIIFNGLTDNEEVLVVTYNMCNTRNYGIVYPDEEGLRLAKMIASNFQKERVDEKTNVKSEKNQKKIYEKLIGTTRKKSLVKKKIVDDYAEKLEELIRDTLAGKPQKKKKPIKRTYSKLSALESDDDADDEDDEDDDEEDD